ncbi:MAG: hypothetical protein HY318_05215, partial [Armatimonadetes bacterium]|nr:hypothetical protein [Armatimonadota bacterium]
AVELTKLSLWIESHSEGLPLTFLDHRFMVGDSLTGPFFEHLLKYPGSQKPMEDLFTVGLQKRFTKALREALKHVRDLEVSVGDSVSDVQAKEAAKARLDQALLPFRIVAAAWAGGVMLGGSRCDDHGYALLTGAVADTGALPPDLGEQTSLMRMITRGLGWEEEASASGLSSDLAWGVSIPALPYELVCPEVFFPDGKSAERHGFDAVLGNPPWDAVRQKSKEFFAAFDFDILAAPTKRERMAIEERVKRDPKVDALHRRYLAEFDAQHAIHDVLYGFQVVEVKDERTGGDPDLAKLFIERDSQLIAPTGLTGCVVPSAFHANEGATGIRRLYLEQMGLRCCYSFENRRKAGRR